MKLTVTRGELKDLVPGLAKIIPAKTSLSVLGCVRFAVEDGVLTAQATDLDQTAVYGHGRKRPVQRRLPRNLPRLGAGLPGAAGNRQTRRNVMNYATALVALPLVCEASGGRIATPEDAYAACRDIGGLAQESFHVLALNAKNRLINRHLVSLGLVDSAVVAPREVFRGAIIDGACSVILAHGHPSGDATPSAEDISITKRLVEAGKIIGIRVIDHVVVGRDTGNGAPPFLSLRERGLCAFD